MKRHTIALAALMLAFTVANAQTGTTGKKSLQEAQEALSAKNYSLVFTKLDEAEKTMGTKNPELCLLRIRAQYNTLNDSFSDLQKLRGNCASYLKTFEKEKNIEVQYVEVYKLSKLLEEMPATEAEFAAKSASKKEEKKAADREAEITAKVNAWTPAIGIIELGLPLNEIPSAILKKVPEKMIFKKGQYGATMDYTTYGQKSKALKIKKNTGYSIISVEDATQKVFYCDYYHYVGSKNDLPAAKQMYDKLVAGLREKFGEDAILESDPPATSIENVTVKIKMVSLKNAKFRYDITLTEADYGGMFGSEASVKETFSKL